MSNEAAMAFFKSMPKKEITPNPYYTFDENEGIRCVNTGKTFQVDDQLKVLTVIREYFRRVYEAFGTEAQVLLVSRDNGDAKKLRDIRLPEIAGDEDLQFIGTSVSIFVLPQVNTPVNSSVSERFWQQYIVGNDIIPVARIHSHHVLDAYQSATDYSTLNSGSLEMVLGHITSDDLCTAYWLDEKGKDTKENVFSAVETYLPAARSYGFLTKKLTSGKPLK